MSNLQVTKKSEICRGIDLWLRVWWEDKTTNNFELITVADPGFPQGGGANSRGVPTYDFAKFFQKLHEIERNWTPRGGVRALHLP